jgi:hypothetical protein
MKQLLFGNPHTNFLRFSSRPLHQPTALGYVAPSARVRQAGPPWAFGVLAGARPLDGKEVGSGHDPVEGGVTTSASSANRSRMLPPEEVTPVLSKAFRYSSATDFPPLVGHRLSGDPHRCLGIRSQHRRRRICTYAAAPLLMQPLTMSVCLGGITLITFGAPRTLRRRSDTTAGPRPRAGPIHHCPSWLDRLQSSGPGADRTETGLLDWTALRPGTRISYSLSPTA